MLKQELKKLIKLSLMVIGLLLWSITGFMLLNQGIKFLNKSNTAEVIIGIFAVIMSIIIHTSAVLTGINYFKSKK